MVKKFLSFDKMITPSIIKVVFWIGVVIVVITGLITMISGLSYYGSGEQVFSGIITILLGPLVIRIYCELLILMFKMYDALQDIREHLTAGNKNTID
ncbi:protein of unknown function [Gracilibacillus ureilyticus]|uniref:DUF4282 domain-containing protein n=1 Tax=Gracilibacillus ureilyticus TaxID=531814 RepID=A0A1H9MLP0_9BACI|nr:DUF4282 domain-containing protein [Gracilibacillus ureilyticus]SER24449.1 protein of unknown function [Gracilibacillus ureilyticus]